MGNMNAGSCKTIWNKNSTSGFILRCGGFEFYFNIWKCFIASKQTMIDSNLFKKNEHLNSFYWTVAVRKQEKIKRVTWGPGDKLLHYCEHKSGIWTLRSVHGRIDQADHNTRRLTASRKTRVLFGSDINNKAKTESIAASKQPPSGSSQFELLFWKHLNYEFCRHWVATERALCFISWRWEYFPLFLIFIVIARISWRKNRVQIAHKWIMAKYDAKTLQFKFIKVM